MSDEILSAVARAEEELRVIEAEHRRLLEGERQALRAPHAALEAELASLAEDARTLRGELNRAVEVPPSWQARTHLELRGKGPPEVIREKIRAEVRDERAALEERIRRGRTELEALVRWREEQRQRPSARAPSRVAALTVLIPLYVLVVAPVVVGLLFIARPASPGPSSSSSRRSARRSPGRRSRNETAAAR